MESPTDNEKFCRLPDWDGGVRAVWPQTSSPVNCLSFGEEKVLEIPAVRDWKLIRSKMTSSFKILCQIPPKKQNTCLRWRPFPAKLLCPDVPLTGLLLSSLLVEPLFSNFAFFLSSYSCLFSAVCVLFSLICATVRRCSGFQNTSRHSLSQLHRCLSLTTR